MREPSRYGDGPAQIRSGLSSHAVSNVVPSVPSLPSHRGMRHIVRDSILIGCATLVVTFACQGNVRSSPATPAGSRTPKTVWAIRMGGAGEQIPQGVAIGVDRA